MYLPGLARPASTPSAIAGGDNSSDSSSSSIWLLIPTVEVFERGLAAGTGAAGDVGSEGTDIDEGAVEPGTVGNPVLSGILDGAGAGEVGGEARFGAGVEVGEATGIFDG